MAVFKYEVFLRISHINCSSNVPNFLFRKSCNFFQILIVMFSLIIFIVSKREQEKELINSDKNLSEVIR